MTKTMVITKEGEAFLARIQEISGEAITACDQCGTCSGSCPMISEMDITPSEMIRKTQMGQQNVLSTKAMWLCAACFACTVRCPRGIDLSKIAEALRQISLRQAVDHIDIAGIPAPERARLPQIALVGAMRKFTS